MQWTWPAKLWVGLALSFLMGCLAPLAEDSASGLDAQFRWNTLSTHSLPTSAGVVAYRSGLSPFLASSCELYPHDSAYLVFEQHHCGSFVALLRAMERFYFEPSRTRMYGESFLKSDQWLYSDLPTPCESFDTL